MLKKKVKLDDEDRSGYQEMGAMDEVMEGEDERPSKKYSGESGPSKSRSFLSWLQDSLDFVDHGGVIRDHCGCSFCFMMYVWAVYFWPTMCVYAYTVIR
jgi:hypothetical protein